MYFQHSPQKRKLEPILNITKLDRKLRDKLTKQIDQSIQNLINSLNSQRQHLLKYLYSCPIKGELPEECSYEHSFLRQKEQEYFQQGIQNISNNRKQQEIKQNIQHGKFYQTDQILNFIQVIIKKVSLFERQLSVTSDQFDRFIQVSEQQANLTKQKLKKMTQKDFEISNIKLEKNTKLDWQEAQLPDLREQNQINSQTHHQFPNLQSLDSSVSFLQKICQLTKNSQKVFLSDNYLINFKFAMSSYNIKLQKEDLILIFDYEGNLSFIQIQTKGKLKKIKSFLVSDEEIELLFDIIPIYGTNKIIKVLLDNQSKEGLKKFIVQDIINGSQISSQQFTINYYSGFFLQQLNSLILFSYKENKISLLQLDALRRNILNENIVEYKLNGYSDYTLCSTNQYENIILAHYNGNGDHLTINNLFVVYIFGAYGIQYFTRHIPIYSSRRILTFYLVTEFKQLVIIFQYDEQNIEVCTFLYDEMLEDLQLICEQ